MYLNWSKSSLRYPHPNPISITIHHSNLPSNTPQRWTKKCSINANAGRFSISANLWRVLSWQIMFFIATFARKTLFRLGINSKPKGGWKRQSHLNISGNINFNKKPFIAPHKRKHKRILKGFQEGERRSQDSTHISIILWLTSVFPLFFPLPASPRPAALLLIYDVLARVLGVS